MVKYWNVGFGDFGNGGSYFFVVFKFDVLYVVFFDKLDGCFKSLFWGDFV